MKNKNKNKIATAPEVPAETTTPPIEIVAPATTKEEIKAQIAALRAQAKAIAAAKIPGKRGRPTGAKSIVTVTFRQLADLVCQNDNAPIHVGRIWINDLAAMSGKSFQTFVEPVAVQSENKVDYEVHS